MQRRRGLKHEGDREAQHEISVPPAPINAALSWRRATTAKSSRIQR
jgi:hypothetical protein